MSRRLRYFLLIVCVIQIAFAIGFFFRFPGVIQLWPLGYSSNLSFTFVASIFAAAAASTLWCVAANEPGALAGVALDYVMILAPTAIFAFQSSAHSGAMLLFGLISAITALFGIGLLVWSFRIPIRDPRPLPHPVRISFAIFIVALVIVGTQLILKTPNVLPWRVNVPASVVYGWFFIGAMTYFVYAVVRPSWGNASGQLAGFLAYDLVLIVPFVQLLPSVQSSLRTNLIIYIGVVVYSGLLALYYLFVNAETRPQLALTPREAKL